MKQYAIIVAGGTGQRFSSNLPKQFAPLKGLPVLMHTIRLFKSFNSSIEIIVTLPVDYQETWNLLCREHKFNIQHHKIVGGETRFHSVKNGLEVITDDNGIVAVHDAVRPFVSHDTLLRCFETARHMGNAIPVIALYDSIRELKGEISVPVNRDAFVLVQTPQVFGIKLLKKSYMQSYLPEFTDDAHVVEKTGIKINLVEGNRENIKITEQSDMLIAEALLKD